jgi:hypothetical protein
MGRAYHHDYRRKGVYHITIKKDPEMPAFGWLSGKLPEVYIRRSSLGWIIARHIHAIPTLNPFLRVLQYTVMPDHIHFLLHVLDTLDRHLGNYIGMFKVRITQEYERRTGVKHSVFEEDFYDCILYPSRSLDVAYAYIRDNPRRLAERVENPDFFQRINELVIGGHRCQAYGNIQLLACPFKEQVVVHRADTSDQREANRHRWLYTASNGGVLVSPFISPAEKAIRDEAEADNGRFILLTNESFGERYKPAAHNFDLCVAGRLLIISVPSIAPATRNECISRNHCLLLNRLSEHVANMQAAPCQI